MKLILTSFETTAEQDVVVNAMIGKAAQDIKVAYIGNAYDVYNDEATLLEGADIIRAKGYDVEQVDLREWRGNREGLRAKLAEKDMFLFTGGNPYYLRWWLRETGADEIITELVNQGKVYSGASAGGVVAGPTLRHFDALDDPSLAPDVIWDGLNLTDIVLVPHIDNAEFGEGCRRSGELCRADGYKTVWIKDGQALIINGDEQQLI